MGDGCPSFSVNFNLRPFRQPIQTHGDVSFLRHGIDLLVSVAYYFYHVPSVLVGFFPWSVFLGPAIVQTFRSLRAKKGTGTFCAQHPEGRSGKRCLSPFARTLMRRSVVSRR